MLTFKECSLLKLEKTFALQQVRTHNVLQEWLSATAEISERERCNLLDLRELLIDNVDDWNEQELALHFIGPLFAFVNFSTERFNAFAERTLTGTVEGIEMLGRKNLNIKFDNNFSRLHSNENFITKRQLGLIKHFRCKRNNSFRSIIRCTTDILSVADSQERRVMGFKKVFMIACLIFLVKSKTHLPSNES